MPERTRTGAYGMENKLFDYYLHKSRNDLAVGVAVLELQDLLIVENNSIEIPIVKAAGDSLVALLKKSDAERLQ